MSNPPLYFRTKENGALVLRITTDKAHGRTDLVPIASVALRSGDIKPQGDADLSLGEQAQIQEWLTTRRRAMETRKRVAIDDLADNLGLATQWVKSVASDEEIVQVSDRLLWAMHDLRTALVRRKSKN